MYKVIWIFKRPDTSVPFFHDSSAASDYKAAFTKLETSPTSLITNRQPVVTDQLYLDQVTFDSKSTYQQWLNSFLTEAPNAIIERNKYVLENNHELLVKIIDDEGTVVKKMVPVETV